MTLICRWVSNTIDKGCKKAVWLASKVKETRGLSAIKLALKVDAEWLCYANAARPPSMTNCLCRFFSAASTIQGLYAFDNLMLDGDDLRKLPLSLRKPLRALSRLKTALSRPKQGFDSPWERH